MPPPPPPPPPSGPPPLRPGIGAKSSSNNAKPNDVNALLGQIQKGTRLKKTQTNDRSAPLVGNNKNSSSAKKYNTIGVHTHRQQPQHHPQPAGPALWRRGSQDDCSAILKQREKILDKKKKGSTPPSQSASPPPVPDANFLNNILDVGAAIRAKGTNKRPVGASGGSSVATVSAQAASSSTRGHAAVRKGPVKVEISKHTLGAHKPLPKLNKAKSPSDSSKGASLMQSNITKVNANINSLNKASSSINNMTKAAANLSSTTSKGFSTVGQKKDVTVVSNVNKDFSVSSGHPEFKVYSSPSSSYQNYSNSPELSKYTNIDHSSSYSGSPTCNNSTEERLSVSSAGSGNVDISLESKTLQYSNVKSEPRGRYGNVHESGGWISNLKKKVRRLSAIPFPTMSSSKSSFAVSHSSSPSSYYSSPSSSTLPTDYSNQQQANLRMVKSASSPSYISTELELEQDDASAQRLVKLRKVPQRQLLTPTKSYTPPESSPSRTHGWRKNLRRNVEGSPTNTGNKVADIRQETVRSLVRDRINTWGNNFKDDGNKQSSGPMNSRGPGSPGGPSPLNKPSGGGIGELFPGGVPKLPKAGLKQRQPGNLSPKPIRSVKNGPTTTGDRTPPPNRNVQNGVMSAKPALANRPKPPPAPPTSAPIGINNNINITNNNNNNNLNTSQTHTTGGLPVNMSRRMPGSHPPPPPPPTRPPALPSNRPTAPKNRPNSMIGRPLPPTPTSSSSSSSSSSSLNRNLPPLLSNKAPQPPERTVSTGGSLPRTRAPTHKPPPPQRPPPGSRPPPPPPARPPSGPPQPLVIHDGPVPPQRSSSNCSIGSVDLEKRGHFHNVHEFPPALPFTGCPKTYPSQSAKNTVNRRAPPPPPPPTGVSIAR